MRTSSRGLLLRLSQFQCWSSFGTWKGYNRKKDPVESKQGWPQGTPSAHESHEGFTAPISYKFFSPKNEGKL